VSIVLERYVSEKFLIFIDVEVDKPRRKKKTVMYIIYLDIT
jgi:hypothetical protein